MIPFEVPKNIDIYSPAANCHYLLKNGERFLACRYEVVLSTWLFFKKGKDEVHYACIPKKEFLDILYNKAAPFKLI